tara:strand:+ start:236 stop:826 length:591 start_codon:yes stop_codon:yes gene_type:complete
LSKELTNRQMKLKKKNDPTKYIILTKNIYLKLVSLDDAKYIYKLRTNKKLSRYLNPTSSILINQINWMKLYFKRNKKNLEYYFKFQIKKNRKFKTFGIARVIKLSKKSFSFGSWIIEPNKPNWLAIECALAIYEFAFILKKFNKNKMWIDLRNKKIIKFHKSMGAIETKRDKKQVYVDLSKKNYLKLKKKFSYFYN